jgi:hypothetical protein
MDNHEPTPYWPCHPRTFLVTLAVLASLVFGIVWLVA